MASPSTAPVVRPHLGARRIAGDPVRELEALAAVLASLDARCVPVHWRAAAFGRRVEAVRHHLRPVASRAVLAQSFERESCRLSPAVPTAVLRADAVWAAYALRFAEIGSGVGLPPWPVWLERRAEAQSDEAR